VVFLTAAAAAEEADVEKELEQFGTRRWLEDVFGVVYGIEVRKRHL